MRGLIPTGDVLRIFLVEIRAKFDRMAFWIKVKVEVAIR